MARRLTFRLIGYGIAGFLGFLFYSSWFMVDYGHNNLSPEQVGKNLAQCVMLYRANEENSLPNGISALRPDLLATKYTRLHFDREPEEFWRWVVTAEMVDFRKRRMVAISILPVKRPGETTRFRAVVWANENSPQCDFALEDAESMEVKFRHQNIVLDTSEVLDWRLRQSGIHWGFWHWLAPFLSVLGFSVVLIELSLWWQRRREDR